ncbi:MAG TPA: biotin--[acetyl-CoA-carboxylase] ligase [Blastocatellia bacterium]|nr:biotin--[acetyl-CoA-carboxylase] ligase [Blastocatellia bacterium]
MPRLGAQLLKYDSVASTNDIARELALSGAVEGLAVVAAHQTAGRGRQGRAWVSPPGQGLYLSLVLRPQVHPSEAPIITLAAAVAVAECLRLDFDLAADIKWPNDLLVAGRKICGILLETATERETLQYAVLGLGVNLRQQSFPEELRETATSLLLETGRIIDAGEFLPPLLDRLDTWYRASVTRPSEVIARWEALSSYARDCRVLVATGSGMLEGVTRGLTARGGLLVESQGECREVLSGEVTLRKGDEPAPGRT